MFDRYLLLIGLLVLQLIWANRPSAEVVDVNHRNIDKILSEQPVLLEFYAPWCSHCKNFESSYRVVANRLANNGFKTGRVDIQANPAISARFAVSSIPSFYLYRDNKIWNFKDRITIDSVVEFCTTGYKTKESLSIWLSPVGPIGVLKGVLIRLGGSIVDLMVSISDSYGIPHYVSYFLIAFAVACIILMIIFFGIYYSVVHGKMD
mmetsp:Transcript_21908/g.36676  ORF Transcript_21908/g.36676 Transcript_21908/m.36676 type:complete len:206 (+) Transcript_21908:44-661(+)